MTDHENMLNWYHAIWVFRRYLPKYEEMTPHQKRAVQRGWRRAQRYTTLLLNNGDQTARDIYHWGPTKK